MKKTHVPQLGSDKLRLAIEDLAKLNIGTPAKRQISNILYAAANPDNERIDVVLKTLPNARRRNVEKTAQEVSKVTNKVVSRGRAKLMDMSQAEWSALVQNAQNEV